MKKLGKKANDPQMLALIKALKKTFPEIEGLSKMASNGPNVSN